MANGFKYGRHRYSNPHATSLNTVDVWVSEDDQNLYDNRKIWIVYIHGGAWRDPDSTCLDFEPALNILSQLPLTESIAGFASINYRLSPYPSHPTNPSSPSDESRNVHHPSHLLDLCHALSYLNEEYKIADRYVLAGHSAGATLAFQYEPSYLPDVHLPQPTCILGIAGIYHFKSFLDSHSQVPVCREIIENAFPDSKAWELASPSTRSSNYGIWERADALVIAHSDEDNLVEKAQAEIMLERLHKMPNLRAKVHFLKATGQHDEIWRNGNNLAGLIQTALEKTRFRSLVQR